jgi:3-deoxy-D-manno-octulosonate 8-phosphate phosphatase KdsC-like HAD superfamily phosphatase
MPKLSAHAPARKIKLLLFDVDGVLTDGKLFIFPQQPEPSRLSCSNLSSMADRAASVCTAILSSRPKAFTPTTARRSLWRA